MELEKKLSDISIFYSKEEYMLLAAAQVQKDLSQFNIEFVVLTDKINFDVLLETLRPIIEKLFQDDRQKIVQLFYRIDVSENKISEALSLESMESSVEQICKEILFREIKKVVIRKHYSSQ